MQDAGCYFAYWALGGSSGFHTEPPGGNSDDLHRDYCHLIGGFGYF